MAKMIDVEAAKGYIASMFPGDLVLQWLGSMMLEKLPKVEAREVDAVDSEDSKWVNIVDYGGGNCYGRCLVCGTIQSAPNKTALRDLYRHCRWCGRRMTGICSREEERRNDEDT